MPFLPSVFVSEARDYQNGAAMGMVIGPQVKIPMSMVESISMDGMVASAAAANKTTKSCFDV
jgi:hypothetical protein